MVPLVEAIIPRETRRGEGYISQALFLEKPRREHLLPWITPQHCSSGSWGRREKPVVFSLALFSELYLEARKPS